MKCLLIILLVLLVSTAAVAAQDGLITKKSKHSVTATLDKLEGILKQKGITIFARVNHTAGAKKADILLRGTELLIFGNPKMGSHFFTS